MCLASLDCSCVLSKASKFRPWPTKNVQAFQGLPFQRKGFLTSQPQCQILNILSSIFPLPLSPNGKIHPKTNVSGLHSSALPLVHVTVIWTSAMVAQCSTAPADPLTSPTDTPARSTSPPARPGLSTRSCATPPRPRPPLRSDAATAPAPPPAVPAAARAYRSGFPVPDVRGIYCIWREKKTTVTTSVEHEG